MTTAYAVLKSAWTSVLPLPVRRALWNHAPRPLKRMKVRVLQRLARGADHDDIYDAAYYDQLVEPTMLRSRDVIAQSIVADLAPRTAIDVGCGTGALLEAIKTRGVDVMGLEYADAAIERCRRRGVPVAKYDIERESNRGWRADAAISTEVAEHLPPACADRFVDLLASLADVVVLSAAAPGVGGADHVNEQPPAYWIEKMAARGLALDDALTQRWRAAWRARGVAPCFWSTVMVFRRTR
jgi:SAM-dependent methyltransferase